MGGLIQHPPALSQAISSVPNARQPYIYFTNAGQRYEIPLLPLQLVIIPSPLSNKTKHTNSHFTASLGLVSLSQRLGKENKRETLLKVLHNFTRSPHLQSISSHIAVFPLSTTTQGPGIRHRSDPKANTTILPWPGFALYSFKLPNS